MQRLPERYSPLNNRHERPARNQKGRDSLDLVVILRASFVTDQDGVGVTIPLARATNQGFATAGIVASASIAVGAYGLIQVYGLHSATRVRGVTSGGVVATPGMPLAINAAGSVFCLETFATHFTGVHIWPCAFMLSTLTNQWTTVAKSVFVKAL